MDIKNFSILPGSETKLLKGLKIGCTGIITATCNVTASLSRKVYEEYMKGFWRSFHLVGEQMVGPLLHQYQLPVKWLR